MGTLQRQYLILVQLSVELHLFQIILITWLMSLTASIKFLLLTITLTAYIEQSDHTLGDNVGSGLSQYRQFVYNSNANFVMEHNSDPTLPWEVKLYPRFAALTPEEVAQKFMISDMAAMISSDKDSQIEVIKPLRATQERAEPSLKGIKQLVNLTKLYGTAVKYQGACGNCYAFATVDAINMFYRRMGINSGAQLSVQQLTDCSKNYLAVARNNGCQGGWYLASYLYVKNIGLTTETYYRYNYNTIYYGAEQICLKSNGPVYKIAKPTYFNDNEYLTPNAASCNSRKPYLRSGYAISVAMFASDPAFYNYKSGVITNCNNTNGQPLSVNHAVIMVGFQASTVFLENFFILKNSWGVGWGELGHFRVLDPPSNNAAYNKCYLCNYGYLSLP